MKRIIYFSSGIVFLCSCVLALEEKVELSKMDKFRPGDLWLDTSGKPIQAHGGGIILRDDAYYWYGEDRTPGQKTSVSCYSSKDLYNWKFEGTAFRQDDLAAEIKANTFIERPKVIYNAKTKKYVLWMHIEQQGYHFARAGIATSDKPMGPFEFVSYLRPIKYEFDFPAPDPDRQKEFGGTYRDMNLFVDDDGIAYVIYASEHNATLYMVRLNDEYTAPLKPIVDDATWSRVLVGKYREAPAPFKYKDKYYLISSGCTGWTPNAADISMSDNIFGSWQSKGNPCIDDGAELTFRTQSTCVLPVAGKTGCYIYMGDSWNPRRLSDSRYIWLPFKFDDNGNIEIKWLDEWDLSYFD
ncbi:MAG: family 43 glycosylhydrolase [Sedimentisphaerales bacterium]|nr:family 43 glycosylhydrolase [Sedimentisphaerales bacterium]